MKDRVDEIRETIKGLKPTKKRDGVVDNSETIETVQRTSDALRESLENPDVELSKRAKRALRLSIRSADRYTNLLEKLNQDGLSKRKQRVLTRRAKGERKWLNRILRITSRATR